MSALAEFQQQFASALFDPSIDLDQAWRRGLAVHRNTMMTGCIDVLRANYPTVERLVGEEWLTAAASIYARAYPPRQPALALYGEDFAEFLRDFAPARDLPYLSEVARLDRLWTEAHFAADAASLDARQLARRAPQQLLALKLQLHPAARWAWCRHSAATVWRLNRPPAIPPEYFASDDAAEGVLLVRPRGDVEILTLGRTEFEFLSRLRAGCSLGEATVELLSREPAIDVRALLARCIGAGVFAANSHEGQGT